jgi:hypothetical protein
LICGQMHPIADDGIRGPIFNCWIVSYPVLLR